MRGEEGERGEEAPRVTGTLEEVSRVMDLSRQRIGYFRERGDSIFMRNVSRSRETPKEKNFSKIKVLSSIDFYNRRSDPSGT